VELKKNSGVKDKIRDICFISVFTAIIAASAQISVPMPAGVPFTMQTFAVLLAGVILGAKRGAAAAFIYIALGAAGVPIFSSFRGGLGVIFGATGGFILSFPPMALCAGVFSGVSPGKLGLRKPFLTAFGLILGAAVNYTCGLLMFCAVTSSGFGEAAALCVAPFILPDIIKMVLAGGIGASVKKILLKSKILI